MDFNEEHKVIIQSMNRAEAIAFYKFLMSEIYRHELDIEQAEKLALYVKDEFAILDEELPCLMASDLNEAWHGSRTPVPRMKAPTMSMKGLEIKKTWNTIRNEKEGLKTEG